MARAHENAAAQGDRSFIDRQFPILMERYEALLENIGLLLEKRRQDAPPEEKLPPLPPEELREQVGTALGELEHFRSRECAGIVEELLRHELPPEAAGGLEEIREQLKLYEDDNAEALLNQLLSKLEKETGSR